MSSPLFFFGAMSPYSWFAGERIGELIPDAVWRPVFAGALFRDAGRSSWGLGERRGSGMTDCEARALTHGLGAIHWPAPWPTNDVLVARAMTFANHHGLLQKLALSTMRMAFQEGADLSQLQVVLEAAERAGLDASEVEQAISRHDIKDELRAINTHARSLGVFGIPTVVIDDGLFWGDDRLDAAAAAWEGATPGPPARVR